MVFNSLIYFVFFAIVILLHNIPLPWKVKKINLVVASYIFYAAWNPPFVILLWISTMVDWFAARAMGSTNSGNKRKALLGLSLFTNLGLLAFFKYGGFLLLNFQALANSLGFTYAPAPFEIFLPVGISFYTFQTLSYTIDVYRGNLKPASSLLDFAFFVAFFPQLVAGPIVRAADLLPQCERRPLISITHIGWGFVLIIIGLFEKIVMADGLFAPVVDRIYNSNIAPGFIDAWTGTMAFSGQIFCDFAGYSTCAIGVGMVLGFALPDNFRFPYAAVGFRDFWRRWHISLSTWLRDYLYISLGGNRRGAARMYFALIATMLLGGLWHGAAWTFVIWGALHGFYLVAERLSAGLSRGIKIFATTPARFVGAIITYLLVCVAWVFFRAQSFGFAISVIRSMIGLNGFGATIISARDSLLCIAIVVCMLVSQWCMRNTTTEEAVKKVPSWLLALILAVAIVLIFTAPGGDRAFIYFQF